MTVKDMSLRDYFAAKAMAGLVTASDWKQGMDEKVVARLAYAQADAMIAARGGPNKPRKKRAPVEREKDPLWDWVTETFWPNGSASLTATPASIRSRIGKLTTELRALGATAPEAHRRWMECRIRYPLAGPDALVKHWATLGAASGPAESLVTQEGGQT